MKNLHVFDFDGTLFKSPEKPSWWPQEGWWGKPESLSPPCVPERPGQDWWVEPVVAEAHRSVQDPETYCILATGRLAKRFHARLHELLGQAGLRFQETHLAPGGGTLQFKLALIEALAGKLGVERIEIWEDRSEHVGGFESLCRQLGVDYEIHLVPSQVHELACGEAEMLPLKVASLFVQRAR